MLAHLFLDNPSVLPLPVPVREKIKGCFFSESISDVRPYLLTCLLSRSLTTDSLY